MGSVRYFINYSVYKILYFLTWLKNCLFRTHQRFLNNLSKTRLPISFKDFNHLQAILYHKRSGYHCDRDHVAPSLYNENINLTYGEIMPLGLARLCDFVGLSASDGFVDLGSGAGKAVLQAALCYNTRVSYGVEVDFVRYQLSQEVLLEAKKIFASDNKDKQDDHLDDFASLENIKFINANISSFDFKDCTVVFANAICFGENLMLEIVNKINDNPQIRALMTTKKVEGLKYLSKFEIIDIETSWHSPPNKSKCYVYYR